MTGILRDRKGVSLLEAVVSLLLLAAVIQGGWAVLAQHRVGAGRVAARAEALETVRTISWLLREETAGGRPGEDWWVDGSDSLVLRTFRGVGLVLGREEGQEEVRVCYRGVRSPNPQKDSVLLLGRDGLWSIHELQTRVRGKAVCPGLGGGGEEEWGLSPEPGDAVLARVFERGSYHLVNGALRYRRGGGGRQPLTPERIHAGTVSVLPDGRILWEAALVKEGGRADSAYWRGSIR